MKKYQKRSQSSREKSVHRKSSHKPTVSILMPVYNGDRYLRAAVDSILAQTMTDFELIVIDDASSDGSQTILNSYADPRLRVIRHSRNKGIVEALNNGLSQVRGRYIARMDADDISYPCRLEKQVAFLEKHPEIGVVGSWIQGFGDVRRQYIHRYPVSDKEIQASLLFESPFAHPSVMIRRAIMENLERPYSSEFPYVEDWELWSRLSKSGGGANIPTPLIQYRIHAKSSSQRFTEIQGDSKRRLLQRIYAEAALPFRNEFVLEAPTNDALWLGECFCYFKELLQTAKSNQRLNASAFADVLQKQLTLRVRQMSCFGMSPAWFIFRHGLVHVPITQRVLVALKVLVLTNARALLRLKRSREVAR